VTRKDASESRWRPRLIGFAAGWAAGVASLAIVALVVVETGAFDVAASTPHHPLVAWATHATMIHAVRRLSPAPRPAPPPDPERLAAGFRLYDAHCVSCHGAPGVARAAWVRGLTPTPPYLLDAGRRWSPGELRWIIRNGVKMTAMPAWGFTRSPAEIDALAAFVETLPNLSAQDYARLRRRPAA
jgi:mono/diheme cytochrome c family protein